MAKKKAAPEAEQATAANGATPARPRLQRFYSEQAASKLLKEFGYSSPMQVPQLEKIVVNVGIGEASKNAKLLESVVEELGLITGQKPVVRRSKKAISNFKLRENQPIGVRVTLRGNKMYEFLDRLMNIALPRVRDFRGISNKGFDGRGNYTLGVKEQIIFPEISIDKVNKISGMDITFVTTAKTDEESFALLKEFGMPFANKN